MQANNVSLTVKVNGRPVAEYQHDGRHYVEGREGTAYSLTLKNDNPFRVKVVPSVDGINVVGGQPATGAPDEIGYVLEAYQSFICDGYRLDKDSVAAFQFVAASGAYAKAEKKIDGTTGVIGLRVWSEKVAAPPASATVIERHDHHHYHDRYPWVQPVYPAYPPYWWGTTCGGGNTEWTSNIVFNGAAQEGGAGCASNSAGYGGGSTILSCCNLSSSASLGGAAEKVTHFDESLDSNPFVLGSTFGAKVQSKVIDTVFDPDRLITELTLFYSTRAGLKTLGVDMSRMDKVAFPQAFGGQYCTPPSTWRG